VDAILASAAIPGVLPPVQWDGRLLIDGGVVTNTPISHAISLGAQQIYVLPTGAPCTLTAPPRGALAMLIHATELMVAQRFTGEVASLTGDIEVVVLPPPCPIDVQPMDFGHAERLMDRAQLDAHSFLATRDGNVIAVNRS
jgi:NTE family protein